jgi:hypothetical protein
MVFVIVYVSAALVIVTGSLSVISVYFAASFVPYQNWKPIESPELVV